MRTGVMCPKGIICQYVNRNRSCEVNFKLGRIFQLRHQENICCDTEKLRSECFGCFVVMISNFLAFLSGTKSRKRSQIR